MTRTEIKATEWAKDTRKECLKSTYDEAIEIAYQASNDKNFRLEISKVYDVDMGFKNHWAIAYEIFYMAVLSSKKKAIDLCRAMKWKYTIHPEK